MKYKHPRTAHVPFSPGATNDDKIIEDYSFFEGKDVIMTEKMDGENTTMGQEYYHARSLDSKDHPSRHYVKGLWGNIKHNISQDYRICGENMYARHSIGYDNLESFFLVHSIWHEINFSSPMKPNICLPWDTTELICETLSLKTVPVLYKGIFTDLTLRKIIDKLDKEKQEGVVIRLAGSFAYEDFGKCVAKWVRPNHVETDSHWMNQKIVPNTLKQY